MASKAYTGRTKEYAANQSEGDDGAVYAGPNT